MATYAQIAADWRLWQEYVDPHGTTDRAEFDAMPVADRIRLIVAAFGPEKRPGRPALPPEQRQDARIEARVHPDLAEKYVALGGVKWLREAIRRARLPAEPPG